MTTRYRYAVLIMVGLSIPVMGCETRMQIVADDNVVFEAEFIPEDENPDLGGTLAFNQSQLQVAPLAFLSIQTVKGVVETEVNESEYTYFEGDVEAGFNARASSADWSSLGTPFAPWSWPTSATGAGNPVEHKLPGRDILGVPILTSIRSLWRNNHGFCSAQISKQDILDGAVPGRNDAIQLIGIENFPFDTDTTKFSGISYLSHPEGLPPNEGASGGVLVNIEGTAEGLGDSSIGLDEILAVELPFSVSDVRFKGTMAIELGLDDGGILTASVPLTPVVSASNTSSCGLHVGCGLRVFGVCVVPLPAVTICLSSEVRSSVRDTLTSNIADANEIFEACQAAPIPSLDGFSPGPLVSCNSVQDCTPALDTLTTINAITDAGSTATPEFKAAVDAQLSLANFKCEAVRDECSALTGGGAPPAGRVCQFVPRAQVLNNYPDAVELVWALTPPDALPPASVTSGHALFYTLSTPLADDVRDVLCQPVDSSPRRRAFSRIETTNI